MTCKKILVIGSVQGVGFRFSTEIRAKKLGLKGYVKNLPDGNVKVMVEGEEKAVEDLVDWCNRGPSGAIIREVKVWELPDENYEGFKIEY